MHRSEVPMPNRTLDKNSPLPYYYQLRELIRDQILSGVWPPGSQLPTEAEMLRTFDVSRTTVRQALADLENEGLIRKERGRGTFVAKPKIGERLVERLTGFYEDMVAQGLQPQTQVLAQGRVRALRAVAEMLEVEPDAPLIRIERLRKVNGEPIQLVVTFIPESLCPGLLNEDLEGQSLYALLGSKYGVKLARGRRFIEAVAATESEAMLLGVRPGAPLLYLRSVTYLKDGRPLEYYEAKHRGDRSRFEVEVIRGPVSGRNGLDREDALPSAWGLRQEPQR